MRTSPTQFVMMVEFMERNGDLSKPSGGPRGRQWAINKWCELAAKLNGDGTGESRSEEKWRKVWTDLKNNTKRKAAKLKKSTGTGGGPALKMTLTDLEQRVISVMGEQAATGMTTIAEVGFEHLIREVELVPQDVEIVCSSDETNLRNEPSPQHDKVGDEEWNLPGTSQQQQHVSTEATPGRKWTPLAKKASKNKEFLDSFLKAERDRDKMFYELEKERIRQRDSELELQVKWLAFMNEVLNVVKKFMEEKK